jgi:formylglycine-generating enzyme required for sulfatase activity
MNVYKRNNKSGRLPDEKALLWFHMKTKLPGLFIALALFTGFIQADAQGTRFFRISGPAATTITTFLPDGTLVWSNALTGTNYTVQTVTSLPGGTNWMDYVQIPVTNAVNTNLIFDFNPPPGMALIPAGMFEMGDTLDGEADAIPTNVMVSAFYMEVNLVSSNQWRSVYTWATNNGYGFVNVGMGKAANHPVQMVDWYDCVKWCNARSQQAGLTAVYYTDAGLMQVFTNGEPKVTLYVNWTASGYRLPTEAEWEKAARGGLSGQRFPWGDTISESQANYYGDINLSYDLGPKGYNATYATGAQPYTSPVGAFAANGYGLSDMAGNVLEWCWDWYGTSLSGGSDPHGPASGGARVLRGGNWTASANVARCAYRPNSDVPDAPGNFIGFRCVRGL